MANVYPAGDPAPADGRLPQNALRTLGETTFGVYLHVPFCRVRCGYCDFNTYTASELPGVRTSDYLSAALAEVELAQAVLGEGAPPVSTVFFGGGTPTLLEPGQLGRLLARVEDAWGFAEGVEVTTEANPETIDKASLAMLREQGINRLSMGMQSVVPHVLQTLDRVHTPGRPIELARQAREVGFDRVSLDLIYGTPGESAADWQASLDAAVTAGVDHISAYSLIVEPGTRMARLVQRGELAMPDDDELADKYLQAEETLTTAGFANYETSNWALSDASQSRHNLAYWLGGNWWGIGPGAHSHVGGVRWWNKKHPRAYGEALTAGRSPAHGRETLTDSERRMEQILLRVRLADGLPVDLIDGSGVAKLHGLVDDGLAQLIGDRVVLTLRGRLLADAIASDLID